MIIVTDPRTDFQAIKESSYVNIPVIALTDTDSPSEFVDVAIPTNNKGKHAIGLIWWLLAREVLRLRGTLADREAVWSVMPDLYFYRDPEEVDVSPEEVKEETEAEAEAAVAVADEAEDWAPEPSQADWSAEHATDWAEATNEDKEEW